MLPVSVTVSTTAMLTGIGGAAMFIPIFLIVFPLLGPEFVVVGPVAAIIITLLTQSSGFSSGLVRYLNRGLVDFQVAKTLLVIAIPSGIVGALIAQIVYLELFKILYGILMLGFGIILLRQNAETGKFASSFSKNSSLIMHEKTIIEKNGISYNYHVGNKQKNRFVAGVGSFLTGLISVGIGELVMLQLIKSCKIPLPVAAATSVLVVLVTVLIVSITHMLFLAYTEKIDTIPWHLLFYTIPGVIIGGQIGSKIQSLDLSQKIKKIMPALFFSIGISMIFIGFW